METNTPRLSMLVGSVCSVSQTSLRQQEGRPHCCTCYLWRVGSSPQHFFSSSVEAHGPFTVSLEPEQSYCGAGEQNRADQRCLSPPCCVRSAAPGCREAARLIYKLERAEKTRRRMDANCPARSNHEQGRGQDGSLQPKSPRKS